MTRNYIYITFVTLVDMKKPIIYTTNIVKNANQLKEMTREKRREKDE